MKKGFTLAELLGVITILGILALIVIPNVEKTTKEGKQEMYQAQIKSIESSARMWGADHVAELPDSNETIMITLSTLENEGYIGSDVVNPITKEKFPPSLKIEITNHETYYTYKVIEK